MIQQQQTWNTYNASWNETDANARATITHQVLAPDVIYRDPNCQVQGPDQVADMIGQFQAQVPGGQLKTTSFLFHHERSIATWELSMGDTVISTGVSYGEYDQDGRLTAMSSFYENPEQ